MVSPAVKTPLLCQESGDYYVAGNVDYKRRPSKRSKSGGWRSASVIIGVEMAEYFAFYGISLNLITYLTGPLGQSTATAAENVNVWSGISFFMPLVGAFVADSFLGRYRTVVLASVLYILALGLLTLSVTIPSITSSNCGNHGIVEVDAISCSPPRTQIITFFMSLYLVAIAQGMHKPCVHAFGADQFDGSNERESMAKSSFFNVCNAGNCLAITLTLVILTYVQENLSWELGFGIPCLVMVFGLILFLLGNVSYRFQVSSVQEKRPFSIIARVLVSAAKNWTKISPSAPMSIDVESGSDDTPNLGSEQFKFLSKALLSKDGSMVQGKVCSSSEVDEAKAVLRLVPIWISCLVYGIVVSQPPTLFTKQGLTMDRSIGSKFQVPAASLQTFTSVTSILFLSLYDQILVPAMRRLTGKPSGITMLQRIGTGIFFSILSISVAALVETKRLQTAQDLKLLSVIWLIPQYLLMGVSQSFTVIGAQEFFYDQVGTELRSVGLALFFTIFGAGSLLSGILIAAIENIVGRDGDGDDWWFSDNPMKGHLDCFYWLLTSISVVAFIIFVVSAKAYTYRSH